MDSATTSRAQDRDNPCAPNTTTTTSAATNSVPPEHPHTGAEFASWEGKLFREHKKDLICASCGKGAYTNKGAAGNLNQGGFRTIQVLCNPVYGGCNKSVRLSEALWASGLTAAQKHHCEVLNATIMNSSPGDKKQKKTKKDKKETGIPGASEERGEGVQGEEEGLRQRLETVIRISEEQVRINAEQGCVIEQLKTEIAQLKADRGQRVEEQVDAQMEDGQDDERGEEAPAGRGDISDRMDRLENQLERVITFLQEGQREPTAPRSPVQQPGPAQSTGTSFADVARRAQATAPSAPRVLRRRAAQLIAPVTTPIGVKRLHIRITDPRPLRKCKSAREANMLVEGLLKEVGIRRRVMGFSRIGNSILEIYTPDGDENLSLVAERLHRKRAVVLHDHKPWELPQHGSKDLQEIQAKMTARLAFLYRRARTVNHRNAILEGYSAEIREAVLTAARPGERSNPRGGGDRGSAGAATAAGPPAAHSHPVSGGALKRARGASSDEVVGAHGGVEAGVCDMETDESVPTLVVPSLDAPASGEATVRVQC